MKDADHDNSTTKSSERALVHSTISLSMLRAGLDNVASTDDTKSAREHEVILRNKIAFSPGSRGQHAPADFQLLSKVNRVALSRWHMITTCNAEHAHATLVLEIGK